MGAVTCQGLTTDLNEDRLGATLAEGLYRDSLPTLGTGAHRTQCISLRRASGQQPGLYRGFATTGGFECPTLGKATQRACKALSYRGAGCL